MGITQLAVLISGNGTNLQALIDAIEDGNLPGVEIAIVVSNTYSALGLQRAEKHGLYSCCFPLSVYTKNGYSRKDYDAGLAEKLIHYEADWIILAGWMHVFSMEFLRYFPGRVINLHPALPGRFPGKDACRRAYDAWRRWEIEETGVMVHLVNDEGVDNGPVLAQETMAFREGETFEQVAERVHEIEHRLLVQVVRKQCSSIKGI